MRSGHGSQPRMDTVRGGTAVPRICTQPFPRLYSTAWACSPGWLLSGVSRWLHEPPVAEPHDGWCFYGPYRPANSNENGREQPYDDRQVLKRKEVVVTLDELRPWWCLIQ